MGLVMAKIIQGLFSRSTDGRRLKSLPQDRPRRSRYSAHEEAGIYDRALRQQLKSRRVRWWPVLAVFVITAGVTQLGIWEYQHIQQRKLLISAIPQNKVWHSCGEVRAAGVAPLFPDDPGYSLWLDSDGDGVACEPYLGNTIRSLRWRLWKAA
jgi:hypothetical protein